ncbi:MAG: type II toxin-antitoxin system HicA family toxin [Proteobacteria bacterium]|nr:type II toxin-antitoxin system HicA family toxin [Pseudomonadota bacterium]MBU1740787.1 type II toxin-antitoxin system HicA family toxin [Pseudomonadota bacterium]
MDSADIVKRLKANGFIHVRTKGSHHKFRHPDTGRTVTIPHPKKDIPVGTLRNIFRQAGWEWRD